MVTEQDKTLDALKTAIQMEIDGKKFYLKASQESSNELGKKLLESLSAEEDVHQQKFREIYEAIRNKMIWPKTDFQPDGGIRLRTIFARTTEEMSPGFRTKDTELDAVQTARIWKTRPMISIRLKARMPLMLLRENSTRL